MLEISGLDSYYGQAQVLWQASLTVGQREIVALLGRNGMGKTSLMRSIMALAAPAVRAGGVRFESENLRGLAPHAIAQRGIGFVPQGRRLFASLTVTEHLTMLDPPRTARWTPARAFELFPRLAERRHHRGNELSGGERQMLAVSRALMLNPKLLLMDEPSEGLSPVMVQHLEQAILDVRADGMSVLLVGQNLQSAFHVADRAYLIEGGTIVHHAPAAILKDDQATLARYLSI